MQFVLERVENIVEKGENFDYRKCQCLLAVKTWDCMV